MLIYFLFIIPLIGIIKLCIFNRNHQNLFIISLINNLLLFIYTFFLFNLQFFNSFQYLNINIKWCVIHKSFFTWGPILLSIDNISFYFILLSNLLIILCIIISWNSIKFMKKEFLIILSLTNLLLTGVFLSMDLLIFYILFESILIPIFLIISIWGARNQRYKASYYFFFYTLFGSLFMFIALLKLYFQFGSTSFYILDKNVAEYQVFLFFTFFLSLAIKVPLFPVHIWLPQAHVEAPVSGSVLLAGILLKLGGYGFIRFTLPLLTESSFYYSPFIITLSIISIIYASILTIKQIDLKRLIAYSSVSHMGFVILGLFTNTVEGFTAALFLMIAHGFVSSGLFISATVIYDRFHSRIIRIYKGLLVGMPLLSTFFLLLSLANISIPGSLNFWGELLVFKASIQSIVGICLTIIILISIVLGAIYSINLFNSLFLGIPYPYLILGRDSNRKEIFSLFILCSLVWILGIFLINFNEILLVDIFNLISYCS